MAKAGEVTLVEMAPTKSNNRLSAVQVAMLMRLAEFQQEESPYGYGRDSGRAASAWHRTTESLVVRGLVRRERFGDHYVARLTQGGVNWLHQRGAL
jgi:hypothetical protein